MAAAAVTAEPAIVCPDCCYDLRGLPPDSDRCPECGLAVETARAREPILPWADRRRIGILIAYARTVRLVTFRPRQLAADLTVPVDGRAARTFWLVTVLLASLPLCFLTFVEPPFEPRIVNDAAGKIVAGVPAPEGWFVPALFGAKPAPARVAYVLLALAAATRAGRPLFRGNPMTERLARGSVLALYTVAPLVVMPLAAAVGLPIMLLIGGGAGAPPATQFLFGAVALCIPVSWGLAAAAWWRAQVVLVGQATHSPARAVSAALLLPLLWLLCAAAFLFVLPWLLGYAALLAGALG